LRRLEPTSTSTRPTSEGPAALIACQNKSTSWQRLPRCLQVTPRLEVTPARVEFMHRHQGTETARPRPRRPPTRRLTLTPKARLIEPWPRLADASFILPTGLHLDLSAASSDASSAPARGELPEDIAARDPVATLLRSQRPLGAPAARPPDVPDRFDKRRWSRATGPSSRSAAGSPAPRAAHLHALALDPFAAPTRPTGFDSDARSPASRTTSEKTTGSATRILSTAVPYYAATAQRCLLAANAPFSARFPLERSEHRQKAALVVFEANRRAVWRHDHRDCSSSHASDQAPADHNSELASGGFDRYFCKPPAHPSPTHPCPSGRPAAYSRLLAGPSTSTSRRLASLATMASAHIVLAQPPFSPGLPLEAPHRVLRRGRLAPHQA